MLMNHFYGNLLDFLPDLLSFPPWFSTIETWNQSVNCCDKPISCSIRICCLATRLRINRRSHISYRIFCSQSLVSCIMFFYNCNFRQALFNDCLYFCLSFQMSDFPDSTQHVSPAAASLIENFQKKNGTPAGNSISTNTARQNFLNSNSSLSSSSVKETSTSSQVSFFFDFWWFFMWMVSREIAILVLKF